MDVENVKINNYLVRLFPVILNILMAIIHYELIFASV